MLFSVNTNGICGQTLNKIIHFLKFLIKKPWYLRYLAIQDPKKIPPLKKGEYAGKQQNLVSKYKRGKAFIYTPLRLI